MSVVVFSSKICFLFRYDSVGVGLVVGSFGKCVSGGGERVVKRALLTLLYVMRFQLFLFRLILLARANVSVVGSVFAVTVTTTLL